MFYSAFATLPSNINILTFQQTYYYINIFNFNTCLDNLMKF